MSKTVAQKHASLIDKLYRQTLDKLLKWGLGASRNPILDLTSHRIVLSWNENDSAPIEIVELLTSSNEFIETFTDEDINNEMPTIKGFDTYWPLMEALRNMAFRQAVGADKAVDDILSELDDNDPF